MVDSIKITALQNIGANIAYTTLVPVVNMSGTPITEKANLQILGNLVLNGAGGSYFARAAQANLALSVANAAQPNITSVGTLTSLAVTGNVNLAGSANVNLGAVANLKISGGTNGYVLSTDGLGNLSWAAGGGGSNYSNSNVANYLPTYTGNVGAGNVNATGTVYTSGISSTGLASLTILNVSTTANLGAVGNVRITGGTSGQKLTTDGAGNLSWTNDANSNYGNSNVAAYLPTFTGTVGANRISSNAASGSNVQINANGAVFTFGQGGALYWPAPGGAQWVIEPNIDNEFEIRSTSNVVISTDVSNANLHFTFASDGVVYCPANANFEGTRLNVGPGAGNVNLATNPTLVVTDDGGEFIQAAILNSNPNGSSDYAAYGADSDETQGFADLGFAGHDFNDPNYTITEPGDGYVFSQGYANGIGGGLVLATGENGNVPDIVFATGGFLANAEFARIDHANDVFHLTRAGSGIKYPDGSIQTTAGGGGGSGSTLVNGDNSFVLSASGNVVFEGDVAGQGVNRGLVWDYGANANGVNSQVRQDNGGLSVRAWTTGGGGANGYSAPVNIVTNQDANLKQWIFSGEGNLTLAGNLRIPAGNIESGFLAPAFNSAITGITTGNATVIVTIAGSPFEGPEQGQVTISSVTGTTEANGIWYYEAVEGDQFELYTDGTYTTPVDGTSWTTYISGGTAVSTGAYSNLAIQGGNVLIKSNDQTWNFSANGALSIPNDIISNSTIDIDNRASGNSADINLYSADDIMLQARDRGTGSGSEGGDINIYAGDSAEDSDSSGGDVVIEAGNGGASNIDFGGSGGFIRVQAGRGGAASTEANGFSALSGGQLTLNAGDGGDNNGNIARGANGGDVSINAGDSTGSGQLGGDIYLNTGLGGGNALSGRVQIITPSSATANGGTWTFDGAGNLTLPGNTWSVNYANGTQVAIGNIVLGNVTFDNQIIIGTGDSGGGGGLYLAPGDTEQLANGGYFRVRGGDVPTHLHFDTGNNPYFDQYFGDDSKYVKLEAGYTGNVVIGTTNDISNYYRWTFDSDGNTTVPGNIKSITTGFSFTANIANVDTTTLANSAVIILANSVFGGPFTGQVTITGVVGTTEANGTWYFEAVEGDAFQLYYDEALQSPVNGTGWPAYVSGGLAVAAGYNNLSITGGNVSIINNNSDAWSFNNDGSTIYPTLTVTRGDRSGTLTGQTLLFGDSTQEAIITTPNGTNAINASQRFVINPGAGAANTAGEGGDIYLYAGRGGDAGGSGGDIKIRGGLAPVDGTGGYLDIQGGDTQGNGTGGYVDIRGGESGNAIGGAVNLYGGYGPTVGGNITITGGQSGTGPGGNVTITGGVGGNGLSSYGNVNIQTGGNTWTFDNTGNLTTPSNLVISESGIGTGTAIVQSDAPLLLASSEANGRASLGWYENTTGPGNVVQVGLNDSGTGSMTVTTGDYSTTTYVWDFDNTGNLTLPTGGALNTTGNIVSNGYARFSGTFDESQASTAGLYLGFAGGTSRMMFATGNTSQTLEIDNDGGTLRFYKPGTTLANLNTSGDFATLGNITATGKIGYANGGTATQTGTGQGVTLNQLTGQITLAKSSWNAGDTEIFNISCNKIANADYVMAQVINGSEASYFNTVAYPFTAVANSIRVQVTAVVASTATPVVQFMIMKAATS